MTNDEALCLIKATEHCYVLWSQARNEIIAVTPVSKGASVDELWRVLTAVGRKGEGPVTGRVFESAAVSLSTLSEQQDDFARDAEWRRTLYAWQTCEVDELLVLLETGVFPPTIARRDAHLLIDEIYYARAATLSSQQLARLEAVAAQAYFSPLGSAVAYNLECKLAVIRNDRQRLERFWRLRLARQRSRGFPEGFAVAAGDLALDLDQVIESFAGMVAPGWGFEARFNAMVVLGKIGAAAGERTAAVISAKIYDSPERLSRLREQVLLRIRTPSSHWKACGFCVRGMVRAAYSPLFERCAICLGLGHVFAEAAQPAAAADGDSPR